VSAFPDETEGLEKLIYIYLFGLKNIRTVPKFFSVSLH
jgi:hypothetical protein